MPYMEKALLKATQKLGSVENFYPEKLLNDLGDADTVLAGALNLKIFDALDGDDALVEALIAHFEKLPPALDAAILAGIRSALQRGLRTQVLWQPAYDFELRVWEVSDDARTTGTLTIHILSPHPEEPRPSKG